MNVLINISDEIYRHAKDGSEDSNDEWNAMRAIANGTPLPKGHGRLIDESNLIPDSDYEDGMFYAVSIGQINSVPTIIEADKETADETDN